LTGIVQSLHPRGHGIIQADDGSKLPFIPIDVLGRHRVLAEGQRVTFSIRMVRDRVFAQNIAFLAERMSKRVTVARLTLSVAAVFTLVRVLL
jgi:cold shock CspA family protein